MGLRAALRPDPRCRHDKVRGFCSTCDGNKPERIPTGTFKVTRKGVMKRQK